MTKRERERINARKRYKYAIVVNATGDSNLAKRDSALSDSKFIQKYGVPIRKTSINKGYNRIMSKRYYANYLYLLTLGYAFEQARKDRRKAPPKMSPKAEFPRPRPEGGKPELRIPTTKDGRKALWKQWIKDKSMPDFIKELCYQVNNRAFQKGYRDTDVNSRYGFAVVYYAFILNLPVEVVENEYLTPETADSDAYKVNIKINK